MSERLLILAKKFLVEKSNPEDFSNEFIEQWKHERDTGLAQIDHPQMSEILSSIFCLVDMFNASDDREVYEFDEAGLRLEMTNLFEKLV